MRDQQRPFVLGVTGGIGSGKTAATDHFARLGITVVDADLAARVIMAPGKPALAAVKKHFGAKLIMPDGNLDRAALRTIVFADPEQRRWLEQLTHPLIGDAIQRQISAADSAYVVLASPLLLEGAQQDLCNEILVIDVSEPLQVQRAMARDVIPEDQIRRIMAAQMERRERLRGADHVIDNSGSLADLKAAVEALHRCLLMRLG